VPEGSSGSGRTASRGRPEPAWPCDGHDFQPSLMPCQQDHIATSMCPCPSRSTIGCVPSRRASADPPRAWPETRSRPGSRNGSGTLCTRRLRHTPPRWQEPRPTSMKSSNGPRPNTCGAGGGSGEARRRLLGGHRAAIGLRANGTPPGRCRFARWVQPGGGLAFDHHGAAVHVGSAETPGANRHRASQRDRRVAEGERRIVPLGDDARPHQACRTYRRIAGSFSATRERRTAGCSRFVVSAPADDAPLEPSQRLGDTSAKLTPCGSSAWTIQLPPGTSCGPISTWPPFALIRSTAASIPSTLT
jgi:hypothetical protein